MKTARKYFLLLALCFIILPPRQAALSQTTTIRVFQNQAKLYFPTELSFEASINSGSTVTKVVLLTGDNGRTCLTSTARQEPKFIKSKHVMVNAQMDFNRNGSLPPGVEIWWQWEIHNQAGEVFTTDKKTILIEDNSYKWKNLENSSVQVFWTEGGSSFGQMVQDQAVRSLDQLEKQAGLTTAGSVRLNIYPSAEAVRSAALKLPEWAAGVAYPEYGTILLGIPPGDNEWAKRSIAHELAHLVTGERIFNCYGNTLPAWLEEGLAVYAEGDLTTYRKQAVEDALEADRLPGLRTLAGGFSANSQQADLSYSQGGVMVNYMLDTYGPEKMAELLSAVQTGTVIDKALLQVYGLDTTGLDQAWRASLGYAAASDENPAAPTPSAANRTPIATLALWTPAFGPKKSATPSLEPTLEATFPAELTSAALAQAVTTQPVAVNPTPIPIRQERSSTPAWFFWAALPVLAAAAGVTFWLIQQRKPHP